MKRFAKNSTKAYRGKKNNLLVGRQIIRRFKQFSNLSLTTNGDFGASVDLLAGVHHRRLGSRLVLDITYIHTLLNGIYSTLIPFLSIPYKDAFLLKHGRCRNWCLVNFVVANLLVAREFCSILLSWQQKRFVVYSNFEFLISDSLNRTPKRNP